MRKNYYFQKEFQLILTIAKVISRRFHSQMINPNELVFSGYMALLKAKENYKTGHGAKFETYASNCIYRAMLKEIGQNQNLVFLEDFSWVENAVGLSLWEESDNERVNHDLLEALDIALNQLPGMDQELLHRYYGFNGTSWTLKQLGEARGVSLQAVHKKINKIEQGLYDSLCRQCA